MVQQEQSELAVQFKRKQILIWGFLFLFMATTVASIFYLAYRIMKEEGSRQPIEVKRSIIKTPISSQSASAKEKIISGEYFIYGDLFPEDKRYKVFKTRYKGSVREEIYSLLWTSPDQLPGLAAYGDLIAVFPSSDSGFLIDHGGKLAPLDKFIPPSEHFSISPDGKKMFYFKFMSSLGNPMLVLRDMEKSRDVYTWPLNSPASDVCDFAGWSADATKAYCIGKKGAVISLKMLDAQKQAYSVIKTFRDATDAKYYPGHSIIISAAKNKISIYDARDGKSEISEISAPENTVVKNVFLAPDGRRVFYTVATPGNGNGENRIYSANMDGSGQKNLLSEMNAALVSLSADSYDMLFKTPDAGDSRFERYLVGNLDGENISDIFTADSQPSDIQLIGWYPEENKTR